MHHVAVIGGGLTGLSTAYRLAKVKPNWQIDVLEKDNRFGGKVKTKRIGDYVVEVGPDSYLARKSSLTDLIKDVGLGDTIVENASGQAFICDKNKFYPIPGGSIVGIPTEVVPFAVSTLISWPGKMRAGLDLFKDPYPTEGDVSIGNFFKYHLGQEMMDKLIEPLLSGIYGGDIYDLSLDATFPEFHLLEKKHGNMLKGVLALRKARAKTPIKQTSQFRQVTGGLESIVENVVAQMPKNVNLYKGCDVLKIELPNSDNSSSGANTDTDKNAGTKIDANSSEYILTTNKLGVRKYDRVIISTPPQAYKTWFGDSPTFKAVCDINLTSCAIVIMAFEKATFNSNIGGTGFLITRKTDTPLTACTYLSSKWPQTTPKDKVVLRVFMGKAGDNTIDTVSEEELKKIAIAEVKKFMGLQIDPIWIEMSFQRKSMPQYTVGHAERINKVLADVAQKYPKLHLIGTPFKGVGMPDGVTQGLELVNNI